MTAIEAWVSNSQNGKFRVKVPAAIVEGVWLAGATLRWEFVHGRELKLRVES
jgi:hypothetical protein